MNAYRNVEQFSDGLIIASSAIRHRQGVHTAAT